MNQLSKLQHLFQDSILNSHNPLSLAWISAKGRVSPKTQLSVYSFAYQARLKEVLANDFPAVLMAIGDENFYQIADDYIEAHPSHYFSLREFGQHFSIFLLELINENETYKNNQWLYELGLFEWTLGQTFDAADTVLFTEHDMTNIHAEDWPNLIFRIHPSVQCLNLEWNSPEIWQALTAETPTQISAEHDETSSCWLFWREQLVTRYRSIPADELLALKQLFDGNTFNDICEALATRMNHEQVPLCAASFLKGWIYQGLITGISSN